ncbi:hypothetical protein [Vulgatibacter sp.]|uniref:hypothetical protein n=1 Tax=Vulgatibacter sp. TaxID=1971226 RepID=UPI00356B5F1B
MSDWNEWQADFTGGGAAIREGELRRYRRRQQRKLAIEVAAAAVVIGWYGFLLSRNPAPPTVALGLASTIFLGVYLTYLFLNRHAALRGSDAPTTAWIEVLRRRVEADLRWNRFLGRSIAGAAILGALWAPWQLAHFWSTYRAEPMRAVIGIGGFYAILGGLWIFRRRQLRQLRAQLADLDDAS